MKVLVCERDPDTADLILRHLERRGHDVDLALDEAEALRKVRTQYAEHLILDATGIGLAPLRALRAVPWSCDVPCVVLTACAEVGVIAEAYRAGADMVLFKPFDPLELVPMASRD